jgi:hypothetical protein
MSSYFFLKNIILDFSIENQTIKIPMGLEVIYVLKKATPLLRFFRELPLGHLGLR